MGKFSVSHLCLLQCFIHLITGQPSMPGLVGPWKHRIEWENNGQVYSLLSTGSEYHAPIQGRRDAQIYLSTKREFNRQPLSGLTSRPYRIRETTSEIETREPDRNQGSVTVQQSAFNPDAREVRSEAGRYLLPTGRASGARSQPRDSSPRGWITGPPGARRTSSRAHSRENATAPGITSELSGSGVPREEEIEQGITAPQFTRYHREPLSSHRVAMVVMCSRAAMHMGTGDLERRKIIPNMRAQEKVRSLEVWNPALEEPRWMIPSILMWTILNILYRKPCFLSITMLWEEMTFRLRKQQTPKTWLGMIHAIPSKTTGTPFSTTSTALAADKGLPHAVHLALVTARGIFRMDSQILSRTLTTFSQLLTSSACRCMR
ncbi:hypothetical protein MATL_G00029010 [Megalops atlanticus]|uniref:Uncharacterized protein n=1 Tax=Megalops atlanticus TaxID=7932 RepID=A0A9D3TJW1_MEGAT|nr:hypothetical protein MATL_G00029010 [Megalops atlanticus]